MTTTRLAHLVASAREVASIPFGTVRPTTEAIVALAAQRDAAIKRAEEAERQLAVVMEMRERDAPLWDRLGNVAKKLLDTGSVRMVDQRDRALALLREIHSDGYGTAIGTLERIAALLAEADAK